MTRRPTAVDQGRRPPFATLRLRIPAAAAASGTRFVAAKLPLTVTAVSWGRFGVRLGVDGLPHDERAALVRRAFEFVAMAA